MNDHESYMLLGQMQEALEEATGDAYDPEMIEALEAGRLALAAFVRIERKLDAMVVPIASRRAPVDELAARRGA